MENEELNINEIVKVESLGVIKQQLDKVEKFIDEKVKDIPKVLEQIENMTNEEKEEQKGDIKRYQQYLSKIQTELENKRKEIKKEINKPYDDFNQYYSNGVYVKLNDSINQLKKVVNDIEYTQKRDKEIELIEFANEHIEANNLSSIIGFEDIHLNITLSASMKSLKEQIVNFVKKVSDDLECIANEENKDEILYIYTLNGYDYSNAILTFRKKQEELSKLKELQKEQEETKEQFKEVVEKVEQIIAPKEIIDSDELLEVTFTVKGTKPQILEIKKLLVELGVEYK